MIGVCAHHSRVLTIYLPFLGTQSGQMSGEGKAGPPGVGPRSGFPLGRGRGRFPGPAGPGGDRFPGPVGPGAPPPHFPGMTLYYNVSITVLLALHKISDHIDLLFVVFFDHLQVVYRVLPALLQVLLVLQVLLALHLLVKV